MARPLIALDADGVLLDFHLGYAGAWAARLRQRAGRARPARLLADRPLAGRAARRGAAAHFRRHFDEQFWSSVPAIEGAVEACQRLHDAGFDLVCVSALDPSTKRHGCATCATTAFRSSGSSPPATRRASAARRPMRSTPCARWPSSTTTCRTCAACRTHVHTALVLRAPNGSPNVGAELALAKSVHDDLPGFADFWLTR